MGKTMPKLKSIEDLRLAGVQFFPRTYQNNGTHIYGNFASRLYLMGYLHGLGIDAYMTNPGMSLFVRDIPEHSPYASEEQLLIDVCDLYNLEIRRHQPNLMVQHAQSLKDWT